MKTRMLVLIALVSPGVSASVLGAARSTQVTLVNRTKHTMTLVKAGLAHGIWMKKPPKTIAAGAKATWASESKGVAKGTEGTARYRVKGTHGTAWIRWNNPFVGGNSYDE